MKRGTVHQVEPPGILRACFNSRIPEFEPLIRSAADMQQIPARQTEFFLPADWDLLYFHTETRLRIGSTRAPWLEAAAHSAVLLAPYTRVWVDTRRNKGKGHHTWMTMEGLDGSPLMRFPRTRHGTVYIRDPEGVLGQAMSGLVNVVVELQPRAFWALQLIGNRILELLSHATPVGDGTLILKWRKSVAVDPLVARILAFLSANLSRKLTLDDIAKHLHTSPSTISHQYRAATGETALSTHRRMRILEVKRLLARGQSLAVIAAEIGYCDVPHLSREFKRQESMTPKAFVAAFLNAKSAD